MAINALRYEDHYSHNTVPEAIAIVQSLQVDKAYLIHMSHAVPPHDVFMTQLPNGIKPAYDGLTIEI